MWVRIREGEVLLVERVLHFAPSSEDYPDILTLIIRATTSQTNCFGFHHYCHSNKRNHVMPGNSEVKFKGKIRL